MPWSKLDDGFYQHPKILQAGPLAGWLFVCGLCYCARYLTDGKIPKTIVAALADFRHVGYTTGGVPGLFEVGQDAEADTLAKWLVEEHLWEDRDDHYFVHDYLKYNKSRRQVLRERKEWKSRQGKHRSHSLSQGESRGVSRRDTPVSHASPVPVPVPVPKEHIKRRRQANRSALQMAQDAHETAFGEASARLVQAASERFDWTLTKTRLADEWRLTSELLEHWDEATILRAIGLRRKLSSMRWLAEFIPQMLQVEPPPERQRPTVLEMPTDLTPEQLANRDRGLAMVATVASTLPKMPA